jgi:CDK-activating kinase assembly factor MAT1
MGACSLWTIRLDRQEDEFETKRHYDDFLELREEMIMNLVLKNDVATTNKKLKHYAIANGLKIEASTDENAADSDTKKPSKKKDVDSTIADPSGLIKGLKKKVLKKAEAPYDPFMGMARRRDHYEVTEAHVTRAKGKPSDAILAAGYDYTQYVDESLLRAFAGLGVFIEDEMAAKDNAAIPVPGTGDGREGEEVF